MEHRGPGMMAHGPSPFDRLDADHDGKITKDEVLKHFAKVDADGDGSITKDEMLKAIHSATGHHPAAGPATQDHRPSGPPAMRGGSSSGGPAFGRGPMGRGPMSGVPMGRGPMGPGEAGRQGPPSPSFLLERFDKNKDGKLTKSEVPEFIWSRLSKADSNGDGEITKDEIDAHMKTIRPDGTSRPNAEGPPDKRASNQPDIDKPAVAEAVEAVEAAADATST